MVRPEPAIQQMADDVSFIRRKEEAKSWGALFGVLFLVALAWWIFHH